MAQVLVIGSGGREHALAWKLAQSTQVERVFVSPGNAGTRNTGKILSIDCDVKDFAAVVQCCKEKSISLVVVGPEDPLANGIADTLKEEGIACFGPSAKAAQIEASKEFSKAFMDRQQIPTAKWMSFTDVDKAIKFIKESEFDARVVKASGLAAGKGVVVAKDKEEACQAVKDILGDGKFGAAGSTVVIEELLEGEEVSCLAFSDGKAIACLPPVQDNKRAYDGDQGPNTGGMGAYSPWPLLTDDERSAVKKDVLQRAIDGLAAEGTPFVGVLYAGVMLTKDGPKVLEFNCRFGDPETQVLMSLLKSDLYEIMQSCVNGSLPNTSVEFLEDHFSVSVVLASEGYPGSYKKGLEITGIDKAEKDLQVTVFHAGTTVKDDKVVTSGGRVLASVATDKDSATAVKRAIMAANTIQFDGKQYRKDIGHKALKHETRGLSYKDSGVDISAGDRLVDAIKPLAAQTSRSGCTAELGMFGGLFDVKAAGYQDPLLVSGTDGVGTKLKIAQECNTHATVGIDLVAMCVNDVLAHGAEPLFFLDYFACGKLSVATAKMVVEGVAEGCKLAGCALLGGETAEMPGMYNEGEYDLAGFTVGAVERENYLPRMTDICEGDVIIGLPSSGVHSNGFSLVRKIVEHSSLDFSSPCPFEKGKQLGSALLAPTNIYCKSVLPVMKSGAVKAFAHITGGGLPGNIPRVLPKGLGVVLNAEQWTMPPVFGWLAHAGNVAAIEMAKTFNCGIGAVIIVKSTDASNVLNQVKFHDQVATIIGTVKAVPEGEDRVVINKLEQSLKSCYVPTSNTLNGESHVLRKKKVGVLISGSGTNLQALIDFTQNPLNKSHAEIVLVISNKAGVQGLERAQVAGIQTKVINHKDFKGRAEFDESLHQALAEACVDIVCLAGFMRILTGGFVRKWDGRMLNVHPSLLPSFKGANAHKLVLDANVRISGCTVHFVAEEVDAGAILVQESVPVYPNDTEDTLAERVKCIEHKAFPKALELVASGKAVLVDNNIKWNL